jgi:hypothetical protein
MRALGARRPDVFMAFLNRADEVGLDRRAERDRAGSGALARGYVRR